MSTDTTSVDALRTRLARSFEVAALRDPAAELAAFEAAVRREAADTVAVDREALANVIAAKHQQLATDQVRDSPQGHAESFADAILASGILRDVREVRHEHGERIAKAIEDDIPDAMGLHRAAHTAYVRGIAIARDLSQPP